MRKTTTPITLFHGVLSLSSLLCVDCCCFSLASSTVITLFEAFVLVRRLTFGVLSEFLVLLVELFSFPYLAVLFLDDSFVLIRTRILSLLLLLCKNLHRC